MVWRSAAYLASEWYYGSDRRIGVLRRYEFTRFITAFSFGGPWVGLTSRLLKVTGFRDSWDLGTMPAGIAYAGLADAVDTALTHEQAVLDTRAREVSQIYYNSFNAMIAQIQSS